MKKGGQESYVFLLENGNLAGRQATIRYAGDSLVISAVNTLADRWLYAARHPIILHDMDRVEFAEVSADSRNDVQDFDGNPIERELIGRRELDMLQVLGYAYIQGCRFSRVVTNIPNHPVRRADFGIGASFHSAVLKYTALYNPFYFADDNETLYIYDAEGTLPEGMAAAIRALAGANATRLGVNQPLDPPTDAVLLTFQEDLREGGGDDFPATATDKIKEFSTSNGAPFSQGYYEQIIQTHIKEFHDDPNDAARVTRNVAWKQVIQTYAGDESTALPLMLSRETVTDIWLYNWRIKGGYNKTIEARAPLPYGGRELVLREVQKERNRMQWAASVYNPDELIKIRDDVEIEGEVLIEGVLEETGDMTYKTGKITSAVPILEAATQRGVTQDGFQNVVWDKIGATLRYFRDTGTNQVDGIETKIDYLAPSVEGSRIEQNIGQRSVDISKLTSVTRLITKYDLTGEEPPEGEAGIPRVARAINAGETPYDLALEVVKRVILRISEKRVGEQVQIEYPYIDFGLRRGSLRKITARGIDSPTLYLITGFQIQGSNLGGSNPQIRQTASAVIVTNS
jgi:hypothetical protein